MTDPTTLAERWLRDQKAYNIENGILASENAVIGRLLQHQAEMVGVYAELARKVESPHQRHHLILGHLVSLAAFWNPEETKRVRDERKRAERLNGDIRDKARELAQLLRDRDASCKGVSLPYDHNPVELIQNAALSNSDRTKAYLFENYVADDLERLDTQFDGKYWPETADVIEALADAQPETKPSPAGSAMIAAISPRTHSNADFIRAWLTNLREAADQRHRGDMALPTGFSLSDESIANGANAALNFDPPFNAAGVKTIRHRFGKETPG